MSDSHAQSPLMCSQCRPVAGRSERGGILRVALIGLAVLIVLGGGAAWLSSSGGQSTKEAALDLVAAEVKSFEVSVTATGELRAKNQTVMRSELEKDAPIVEIVEEGKRVSKGDVLVRLNSDDIQSDLDDETLHQEAARADVITAEAAVQIQESENRSTLKKAQLEVELSEIALKKWEEGEVQEERLKLDTAVEKGIREHERLKTKLERSEQLFARDFLSKDELDKDRIEFIEAESALTTARVAKDVYEKYTYHHDRKKVQSDFDEKKSELERVERKNASELESKTADLTNKRRQLELRDDKVKKLQGQLGKASLRAPTDGLVVYATSLEQFGWMNNNEPLNVGSVIRPNQEIIMLPDTSDMVATVKVNEALVGRVKPGQRAEVTVDAAQGKRFSGVVESIGIMAQSGGWRDPNVREYEVRIDLDLDEEAHGLKPSMRAEARLILMEVEEALAVPVQAVFSEGPHQFVYMTDGRRFRQTPVQVGRRSDVFAEVREGLKAGERVLLREPPTGQITKATFPEVPQRGPGGKPGAGRPGAGKGAADGAAKQAVASKEPAEAGADKPAEANAEKHTEEGAKAIVDAAKDETDESADDSTPEEESSESEAVEKPAGG